MNKIIVIDGNNNDKDNVKAIMVKGERGYSAYEVAVQNGYTGTVQEWLDSFINATNYYNKTEINGLLNTEETERINADLILQNNIDGETVLRENADTNLQNSITNEIGNRQAETINLQNQINVERGRIDAIASLPSGSTTGDAELIDIRTGYNGKIYGNAGTSVRTQISNLHNNINSLLFSRNIKDNYIDKVEDYFVANDGVKQSNSSWEYRIYNVTPNTSYVFKGERAIVTYYSQLNYDMGSNYLISGGEGFYHDKVITTPANTNILVLSTQKSESSTFKFYINDNLNEIDLRYKPTENVDIYNKEEVDTLIGNVDNNIIKVTEYTINNESDLKTTLEYILAQIPNFYKRYVIKLEQGTYDIKSLFTSTELANNPKGLLLPPFTKLIGLGNPEQCVLTIDNTEGSYINSLSTLNIDCTASIYNLKIIAKNIRYPLHNDWNMSLWGNNNFPAKYWLKFFENEKQEIINCIFEGTGSLAGGVIGCGVYDGVKSIYKGNKIISNGNYPAVRYHNNKYFTLPTQLEFISNVFETVGDYACRFETMTIQANSILNYIYFYGNKIQTGKKILLSEVAPVSSFGGGCLFIARGFGNTFNNTNCEIVVTDSVDYSANLQLI